MKSMVKVIVRKKGFFAIDFNSDSLGYKWVKISFRKRGRLGKLLKIKAERIIKVPKGFRVISINNNKPKIGSVTINYEKIRGRKKQN